MSKICDYFDGKSSQDAQEFLGCLLENLHDNIKTAQAVCIVMLSIYLNEVPIHIFIRNHQSLPNCLRECNNQVFFVLAVKPYVNNSGIHGYIQCPLLLQTATRDDPFMFLPIAIPEKQNVWYIKLFKRSHDIS